MYIFFTKKKKKVIHLGKPFQLPQELQHSLTQDNSLALLGLP